MLDFIFGNTKLYLKEGDSQSNPTKKSHVTLHEVSHSVVTALKYYVIV